MKLVKYIGDIIDQAKTRKLKEKDFMIALEKILLEAEQFEKDLELRKSNSPILVAERIANYKIEVDECKKCNELFQDAMKNAIKKYNEIGSVQEQFERGEDYIIQNPDQDIWDLRKGNVMVVCKEHRKIPIIIKELYKVNK